MSATRPADPLDGGEPGAVYLLGMPFTGSTLIALALGAAPGVTNLGEMLMLENDFHGGQRCSCGATLDDCPFWRGAAAATRADREAGRPTLTLERDARLHAVDSRAPSRLVRLALLLRAPLRTIYGATALTDYAARHEGFVRRVAALSGSRYVVDASKSARRLAILRAHGRLRLRVLLLHRPAAAILAGRVKRARRRQRRYTPLSAAAMLVWLLFHIRETLRAWDDAPADEKRLLSFEAFARDPAAAEAGLRDWLEVPREPGLEAGSRIDLRGQHVFTGNRWLFRHDPASRGVEIRPAEAARLDPLERRLLDLARMASPALRRWEALAGEAPRRGPRASVRTGELVSGRSDGVGRVGAGSAE